uniref:5-hydroxyisourate hydrolase n=1 Tax=Bos indicus x Bos taurus TaxID=30522 RepID=A0A4W2C7F3_BOBOX
RSSRRRWWEQTQSHFLRHAEQDTQGSVLPEAPPRGLSGLPADPDHPRKEKKLHRCRALGLIGLTAPLPVAGVGASWSAARPSPHRPLPVLRPSPSGPAQHSTPTSEPCPSYPAPHTPPLLPTLRGRSTPLPPGGASVSSAGLRVAFALLAPATTTKKTPRTPWGRGMEPGSSPLTTHVLDTASGLPAQGLYLRLSRLEDCGQQWTELKKSCTDRDGRCPGLLPPGQMKAGTYKLSFDTKGYWQKRGQESFYPYVEVVFTITNETHKFHVPLLLSPWSYTTYRGS